MVVDQKLTGIPGQEHILKPREYIPETNETTTVAMDVTEGGTTTEDAAAALKVARAEDSMARYALLPTILSCRINPVFPA